MLSGRKHQAKLGPLLLLRDIHSKLLAEYGCKEGCAPSQSQAHAGVSGRLSSQDGDAQQQEAAPLFLPQLNKLHEASHVRGEDASNVAAIPPQNRLTHQILSMWQQRVGATVEDSVLHTEMDNLESEEEDAPRRVLWYKPMSWLGQIRPHRRDEAWSLADILCLLCWC